MKQLTVLINQENQIERLWEHDIPDEGSIQFPQVPDGYRYWILTEPFDAHNPPTKSSVAMVDGDNIPYWLETSSLESLKITKNVEINSARLHANRSYFVFEGKQIACDELSRSDIDAVNGVVSLLNIVPIAQWKAVDNTYVQIPDKPTWIQFYMAMVSTGQANFEHAQNLKGLLASATTSEEIAVIKWS